MMEMTTGSLICSECARRLGGRWTKSYISTWRKGRCGICLEERGLASAGDWDWPPGKTAYNEGKGEAGWQYRLGRSARTAAVRARSTRTMPR